MLGLHDALAKHHSAHDVALDRFLLCRNGYDGDVMVCSGYRM